MKFRVNRSWYICPVQVEGKGSFQTQLNGPGIYDMPLIKDDPSEGFMYARSTFLDASGNEMIGTVELMREVIEIISKEEGEDGWQNI